MFAELGSNAMPIGNENGPTTELGSVVYDPGFIPSWGSFVAGDELEENAKLIFPQSISTYHNMRTDPQVQGLLTGSIWPLLRMKWYLRPNGARDEAVEKLSADLNLPISIKGDGSDITEDFEQRRTQNRFKFLEHMEAALDSLCYGFSVFEQNGYIGDDGLFHYRKLAPRPAQTISEMQVGKDGGLEWIRQFFADAPKLSVDRLVMYSFQKRGANWHGRSLLRGCYGPWLLKDRALRVGVMNIQRAGVGTPVGTGHPGASEAELLALSEMMKRFAAGDRSGGAVPYGSSMRLVGVEGGQPDTVGFIKLLNEEMARAFFQMFMQLGQTTSGSRALGQTFVEYHRLILEYIAWWFSTIFNEHVIEDDIEWNYGPDESFAPLLCWGWDEAGSYQNPDGPEAAKNPSSQVQKLQQDGDLKASEELANAIHGRGSVELALNGNG